jgi:protein involved in polysaccharide export with SLBB domain
MRSVITIVLLVLVTTMCGVHFSYASSAPAANTDTRVEPYVYVYGAVSKPGRYDWIDGMTVLDAIYAVGGFTNFVTGRIEIFHTDGTKGSYKYQGAVDDTNKPPLLKKGDIVSVPKRIF